MLILTLLIVSLLCLAINTTRIIGIIGLILMFYLYPALFAVIPILGGLIIYYHYK